MALDPLEPFGITPNEWDELRDSLGPGHEPTERQLLLLASVAYLDRPFAVFHFDHRIRLIHLFPRYRTPPASIRLE